MSIEGRRIAGRLWKESHVKERVQAALDKIRPALQADGGDVELVDVSADGVVKVALQGSCRGCPMSQLTLANGVERVLKEEVARGPEGRAGLALAVHTIR